MVFWHTNIYAIIIGSLISICPLPWSNVNKKNIDGKAVINIPLIRAGKLLLLEAKVDGQVGNLVFDTGATGIVLNSTYFRDYVKTENGNSNGIGGSVGQVYSIHVDSLDLGDLSFQKIKADMVDLGHIENKRGIRVLGLFGLSLTRNYEVIIDASKNQLTLLKIDRKGEWLSKNEVSFKPHKTVQITESNNVVFFEGTINGKSVKFCLDTGAEINSVNSSLSKSILSTISITRRVKLTGACTSCKEVLYGVMNDIKVANRQFGGMETVITNLSPLESAYNTQFGGVIGFDFLKTGVISINIRKKQMGIYFTNTKEQ